MFRLAEEIEALPNCPPSQCTEQNLTCIRFVFDPVTTESFVTYYEQDEQRYAKDCKARALSFFDSIESAKAHFNKLRNIFPNVGARIGTHLAQGELNTTDGMITNPSRTGHLSLFEYVDADLVGKFTILEQL